MLGRRSVAVVLGTKLKLAGSEKAAGLSRIEPHVLQQPGGFPTRLHATVHAEFGI